MPGARPPADRGREQELLILGAGDHARVVADVASAAGLTVIGCVERAAPIPDGARLFIAAIGDNARRRAAHSEGISRRLRALSVVHPSAVVARGVTLGPGAFIGPGVVLGVDVGCAEGVIVNTAATADHDCRLGPFSHLGPGAHLCGRVTIGAEVTVGVGASVVPGVTIGDQTLVGAGSVVVSDLPPNVVAWGVPARVQRKR
jgi:sugar O-acyltransferase (sialic acid O-acetyltransferase NeuD family)